MRKLYCNGDFIPMTGEEDTFEALVVEDGVIAFTGDLADAEEMFPDAEKIDVDGAAVMPGFVDGHSHFLGGYQMVTQADLGACRSFSQIQDTLRTFMEQNQIGPDGVLLGTNYDQNELEEGHHPDKFVLDQVSTEVPIYISHVSSHMGAANSKALEVCGITSETPDPEGGRFGRVEGTAEPNGFIEEVSAVMQMTVPLVGRMKVDQREVYRKVQDIYLSHGITTCQDGASVGVLLANVMPLVEEGLFDLDIVGYPMLGMDKDEVCERYGSYMGREYHNHFRFGGLKQVLDGSPQGRTAWMSEPYTPGDEGEGWCAYPALTDEQVIAHCKEAIDGGYQLLTHTNGDAASEQLLRCYKEAYDASDNPRKDELRPVMIHCQTTRRDQYERMGGFNMIPSIFTSHIWFWGDAHLKNFGPERGSRISAVRDAVECGLVYNFHTDCPIVPPDMLHTVWCAANRVTKGGAQLDERQKVSVYEGLKGITINAAYAYYEEDAKGTLEVGKLADLVLLDKNPLKVDPMEVRDISVLETVKEGETVWKR